MYLHAMKICAFRLLVCQDFEMFFGDSDIFKVPTGFVGFGNGEKSKKIKRKLWYKRNFESV